MDQEQVFKVPLVRKKRPNLYCKETLDGLDDIWQNSNTTGPAIETSLRSHPICSSKTPNTLNERCNSDSYKQTEVANVGYLHSPHNKYEYAVGLLNEFSKNIFAEQGSDVQSCRDTRHEINSMSTTMETLPGMCNSDEDVNSSISPDVLIVPDQSMDCSEMDSLDYDVDWDSLTPPVPRSPGDHTVPDLYELDNICPPSDCLINAYDRLASVQTNQAQRGIGDRELRLSYMQIRTPAVSAISSLDHIVPDFYG
ncbi:hypothetical protein EGW08_006708 [Elysia chlorotica]|uniref:Uncharacterized protein n=1 Tax=Elysia chlorotica TaxID=188477 RepID=A0A433TV93_ELYCH|nr:hypothetical protein EGW08_006708 [Elysia chlorotica]